MGLFNFGFGSLEKHQREKYKEKGEDEKKKIAINMSRRGFLKTAAATTGSVVLAGTGLTKIDKMAEFFSSLENKKEGLVDEEETEEQKRIAEEDRKSLSDILDYKKDKIELNLKSAEQVKNYWRGRYRNEPLKNDFSRAFREMGSWQKYLEEIFEEEGVDKKYIYLAIPESHWQMSAVSGAQAVGPYQFIPETAASYGLKMDWRIDERKDPLKSGHAAARLLKHLHHITGDWNLALSGYNGGYLKGYIEQSKEKSEVMSYEGFLKYMQNKINNIKEETKKQGSYTYKAKGNIRLSELAEKLGVRIGDLCRLNQKSRWAKIREGQKIEIPLDEKEREKLFNKKIRGFTENLNYPQKFDAVYELIDEGFVKEQRPTAEFSKFEVHQEKVKFTEYKAKPGDGLNKISRHFSVSVEQIKMENVLSLKNGLQKGEILKIPINKTRPVTLERLAQKKGVSPGKLKFLNPAIKSGAPIPDGYIIRS